MRRIHSSGNSFCFVFISCRQKDVIDSSKERNWKKVKVNTKKARGKSKQLKDE
jgi:hypothetical protein